MILFSGFLHILTVVPISVKDNVYKLTLEYRPRRNGQMRHTIKAVTRLSNKHIAYCFQRLSF